MFFHVTEEGWVRRGRKRGIVGKFSFRIVCQNPIPFPRILIRKRYYKTLGTIGINSPMSPPSLGRILADLYAHLLC